MVEVNNEGDKKAVDSTLNLLTSDDAVGEVQRVLSKLEAQNLNFPVSRLLANSGAAFRPFVLMSDALLNKGLLSPHLRECIILALATRLDVEYEWREHVKMATRAGVTSDEQDALAQPFLDSDRRLSDETRFVVATALSIADGNLTDEEWEALCARYGKHAALEVVIVVGWWGGFVPIILKAVSERARLVEAIETERAE